MPDGLPGRLSTAASQDAVEEASDGLDGQRRLLEPGQVPGTVQPQELRVRQTAVEEPCSLARSWVLGSMDEQAWNLAVLACGEELLCRVQLGVAERTVHGPVDRQSRGDSVRRA
jgi:hypothetical protein